MADELSHFLIDIYYARQLEYKIFVSICVFNFSLNLWIQLFVEFVYSIFL